MEDQTTVKRTAIALERRLRNCRNVITLGVRPNFGDYTREEAAMIRGAQKIFYPTTFYADLFDAMGKAVFPSYHNYKCVQDKIKQTALFQLLGIPHPKTRVFYGRHQKMAILQHFDLPLIAKIPRGSAMGRGIFLIRNRQQLDAYCRAEPTVYIQEHLPIDRDIRAVVIGRQVVHAYWRIAAPGEFRTNVSMGGAISLDPVPPEALALALSTAESCGWNDVGIDICYCQGRFYILEANMKYGREGFRQAGIDYDRLMERLIEDDAL